MRNSKVIPRALVGIAGVHYVTAELSIRGLVALPTVRNTAGYDVIVTSEDGKRDAHIQVKTAKTPVRFWPMPKSDKIRERPNDYYVLVRYLPKKKQFEGFMLKGREAKREVMEFEHRHRRSIKRRKEQGISSWRFVGVGGRWSTETQAKRWKDRWERWPNPR